MCMTLPWPSHVPGTELKAGEGLQDDAIPEVLIDVSLRSNCFTQDIYKLFMRFVRSDHLPRTMISHETQYLI